MLQRTIVKAIARKVAGDAADRAERALLDAAEKKLRKRLGVPKALGKGKPKAKPKKGGTGAPRGRPTGVTRRKK